MKSRGKHVRRAGPGGLPAERVAGATAARASPLKWVLFALVAASAPWLLLLPELTGRTWTGALPVVLALVVAAIHAGLTRKDDTEKTKPESGGSGGNGLVYLGLLSALVMVVAVIIIVISPTWHGGLLASTLIFVATLTLESLADTPVNARDTGEPADQRSPSARTARQEAPNQAGMSASTRRYRRPRP